MKILRVFLVSALVLGGQVVNAAGWMNSAPVTDFFCQTPTSCMAYGEFQTHQMPSCGQVAVIIDASRSLEDFKMKYSLMLTSLVSGTKFKCWVNDTCKNAQGTSFYNCVQVGLRK